MGSLNAGARVVDLSGELDWVDFEMPGGSIPVGLATLRTDARGGPTALVRFPHGFRREVAGSYEVAEEFTVLNGTLSMSGRSYAAPRWVYAPAGCARTQTHVRAETLALARFDGKARWHDGPGDGGMAIDDDLAETFDGVSPLGRARLLRTGDGSTTWWVARAESRETPVALELLDPSAMLWAWIPAGEQTPEIAGPCLVRTVEEDG